MIRAVSGEITSTRRWSASDSFPSTSMIEETSRGWVQVPSFPTVAKADAIWMGEVARE